MQILKKSVVIILCVILVCSCVSVCAKGVSEGITLKCGMPYDGVWREYEFLYSDECFTQSDEIYHQDIAKLSFGLTFASARELDISLEEQGRMYVEFLTPAGFENFDLSSYRHETQIDSASYGIASKQIGDTTLIAIGICSRNYGNEWAGNAWIGSGNDHEGFKVCADIIYAHLEQYEAEHNITGKKALWVSGFSRGASVGNLLAAQINESGRYDSVYAYLFGGARTTKTPKDYKNIFNIMGKDDFVPLFPFSEWGYGRHGVDMYLPSSASDSDFYVKALKTDEIHKDGFGVSFSDNAFLNMDIRVICSLLYDLIPDSQTYVEKMEVKVLSAYKNGINNESTMELLESLSQMEVEPEDTDKLELFIAQIRKLLNEYVYQGNTAQRETGSWDDDAPISYNIAREHNLLRYISWVFSTDEPQELYSENTDFHRFVIDRDSTVEIYDEYGLMETYDDGKIELHQDDREIEQACYINIKKSGSVIIALVPMDREFKFVITPKKNKTKSLLMYSLVMSGNDTLPVDASFHYETMISNSCTVLFSPEKTDDLFFIEQTSGVVDYPLDIINEINSATLFEIENKDVVYFSISDLITAIMLAVVLLVLGLLVSIILAIVRKIKKRPRSTAATVIFHGFYGIMLMLLFVYIRQCFPGFGTWCAVFVPTAYLFSIVLGAKGYALKKNKSLLVLIAITSVVAVTEFILDFFFIKQLYSGVLISELALFIILLGIICFLCFKRTENSHKTLKGDL